MDLEAERVRLVVDRVGTVDAVVARAVPGAAELLLQGTPPAPARFLHRRTARAQSIDRSAEMVPGTVLAIPDPEGGVREDLVHFLFAHVLRRALAEEDNRREHARVPVSRPVTLIPDRVRRGWIEARTVDVSAGGALVSGADLLGPGDGVRLRLELDAGAILDAHGRITRTADGGVRGIALDRIEPGDRERISRWVAEQRRAALRALRAH